MNNPQLRELPVLERFLAALNIGVANFTLCDIRDGWSARFDACATASLHYCMDGSGVLMTQHGESVSLSSHSFVLLPPGVAYKIESGKSCILRETDRGVSVTGLGRKRCPPSRLVVAPKVFQPRAAN